MRLFSRHATEDELPLEGGAAQLVLQLAQYAHAFGRIAGHDAMLSHIYRALRNGGRLVLLEPFHETARGKSREAQVANHDLAPEFAEEELRRAGFTVLERRDGFIGFVGQPGGFWLIIAVRPKAELPQRM